MRRLSIVTLGAVLLLALLSAVATAAQLPRSASANPVSVFLHGELVRIEVALTTPLNQVLNAFCGEEKIQCAGSEALSDFPVASITISGTAEEVIASLLQGTGVNYSISRSQSGEPERITVLGRGTAGIKSAYEPAAPEHGNLQAAQDLDSTLMPFAESESAEESARSERVMEMIFGGASAAGANTASAANGSATGGATQAVDSKVPQYLPFPDQFGNPIPAAPVAPPAFLPFPDHNGNPIPVTPVPGHGSPFPLTGH